MLGKLLGRLESNTIPINGKPYLTRYYLTGRNKKFLGERPHLYLHHFHMSDQPQEVHNHPHTGTSLILRGGYIEERMSELGEAVYEPELAFARRTLAGPLRADRVPAYAPITTKVCRPGDINRLGLLDFHRAVMLDSAKGAWTLFYTGPRVKEWGFLDRDTLEFFPYEGKHTSSDNRGKHTAAQKDAVKSLEDEVTLVLGSHLPQQTPGRLAQAQRLGYKVGQ